MAETPQDPASLVQENAILKAKLEDYKKLEEDLLAKRVFDKARGYLTTWITLGGIILTLAGFVGYQSVVSYFTDLAKKKADAISEKQMTEIVQTRIDIRVQTRVDQEMPKISERVYQNMIQRAQPLAVVATSPSANPTGSQSPKTSIDWSAKMPALRDQGPEGSVAGLALATTLEFYISQATGKPTSVSAREIYYEVRLKTGTFPQDTGGLIKDGIDFLKKTGLSKSAPGLIAAAKLIKNHQEVWRKKSVIRSLTQNKS